MRTGADGTARIAIGDGDYFVCAGGPGGHDWTTVRIRADVTTEARLDVDASPPFAGEFELRYDASEK